MQVHEIDLAEKTRLVRKIQIMISRHRKSYTEEREENTKVIRAEVNRDPELLQTFFDYDKSLGELSERRLELQDVVEHLFEYHLKSDYAKEHRIPIHNAKPI